MSDLSATGCGCNNSCGNNGSNSIIWIICLLCMCGGLGGNNDGCGHNGILGGNGGCGEILPLLLILCCCGGLGNNGGCGC